MKRKALCVVNIVALSWVSMISSMASAAILSDDFESGVIGTQIVGQTADTGQLYYELGWTPWLTDTFTYNATNATGGVQGGGTWHSSGAGAAVNIATQTTGILRVTVDLMEIAIGGEWNGGVGGGSVLLLDTVNGTTIEVGQRVPTGVQASGNLISSGAQAYLGDGVGAEYFSVMGGVSIVLDIDLDNKLVDFSWDGFTPVTWAVGLSGAVNDMSYAGTFNPNQVILWAAGGRSGLNYGGYDNVLVYQVDCDYNISEGSHILGDINNDCYVNMKDLLILTENWLKCDHPMDTTCD